MAEWAGGVASVCTPAHHGSGTIYRLVRKMDQEQLAREEEGGGVVFRKFQNVFSKNWNEVVRSLKQK